MGNNGNLTMLGILVVLIPPLGIWLSVKDKKLSKIQKTIHCCVGIIFTIAYSLLIYHYFFK